MKIAILFGGCDGERDISLNSARSVYDHLPTDNDNVELIYISSDLTFCHLPSNWIYSNTTDDFDHHCKVHYAIDQNRLQYLLQKWISPFRLCMGNMVKVVNFNVYWNRLVCHILVPIRPNAWMHIVKAMHDTLHKGGFKTYPNLSLNNDESLEQAQTKVCRFLDSLQPSCNVVIKPARSGSSIGVHRCDGVDSVMAKYRELKVTFDDQPIIIEPYMNGMEFTICLIETNGVVKPFEPTEIHKTRL